MPRWRRPHRLSNSQLQFLTAIVLLVGEILLLILLGRRQIHTQLGGSVTDIEGVLQEIASGNLAVDVPKAPEASALGQIGVMNQRLRRLIGEVNNNAGQLVSAVGSLHQTTSRISDDADQVNQAISPAPPPSSRSPSASPMSPTPPPTPTPSSPRPIAAPNAAAWPCIRCPPKSANCRKPCPASATP